MDGKYGFKWFTTPTLLEFAGNISNEFKKNHIRFQSFRAFHNAKTNKFKIFANIFIEHKHSIYKTMSDCRTSEFLFGSTFGLKLTFHWSAKLSFGIELFWASLDFVCRICALFISKDISIIWFNKSILTSKWWIFRMLKCVWAVRSSADCSAQNRGKMKSIWLCRFLHHQVFLFWCFWVKRNHFQRPTTTLMDWKKLFETERHKRTDGEKGANSKWLNGNRKNIVESFLFNTRNGCFPNEFSYF